MIATESLVRLYVDWLPYAKALQEKVGDRLRGFCNKKGFIFEDRIKSLESLSEKVESGRFRGWPDIDDLYGCTVAVPLFEDEEEVIDFLDSSFVCAEKRLRGRAKKPPDVFRFDSTRYVARLKPPPGMDDKLFSLKFEVQVKSLFEYAWSKTTHALAYKSSRIDWRRRRLAAHLKAATEQIDFLLVGFDSVCELVDNGHWPDVDDKEKILRLMSNKASDGTIPREATPNDWSRFSENLFCACQAFAGKQVSGRSSNRLTKLDLMLEKLESYFDRLLPGSYPMSVSLFQLCVAIIANSNEFNGFQKDYYLPITNELRELFPDASFPCSDFQFEPKDE